MVRRYLKLRHQSIPYLYTESHLDLYTESHLAVREGLPLMRPLVLDFQDDPNGHAIEDQFMCGRNIMVASVLTKDHTRQIYLPEGTWYHFWEGKKYEGGRWITETCPLDKIPVFIMAGSILPLGREVSRI